jgi:Tol biopolymer transport system component
MAVHRNSGPHTARTRRRVAGASIVAALTGMALAPAAAAQPLRTTVRVSATPSGRAGNADSFSPSVNGDGSLVAFASGASNLVAGDTNGVDDIFVRDLSSGRNSRVSVGPGGAEANGNSEVPAVSGDGRIVAFQSTATNMVPGDTNNTIDVFVRDRSKGTTTRVSVTAGGAQGDGHSVHPAVSADGRFVAFQSNATNLVAVDTNGVDDVFVHDLATGGTTRVSGAGSGGQAVGGSFDPAISSDGRFVAFTSEASNLVRHDTNGLWDVFVHDGRTATTTRVSVATGGGQAQGGVLGSIGIIDISADGATIAFQSDATNLVAGDTNGATDVFIHNRRSTATKRVSVRNSGAQASAGGVGPSISADGRRVAFTSFSPDLVAGDTNNAADIFVRNLGSDRTERVSVGPDGTQGNADSAGTSISGDGATVAYSSTATNLVDRELPGISDIFAITATPRAQ